MDIGYESILVLCIITILLGITYYNKNILQENFIDVNKLYDRTTCTQCLKNNNDSATITSSNDNNATKRFSRLYRHTLGLKNSYDTKFCSSGNPALKDPCPDILNSSQAYIPQEMLDECKKAQTQAQTTPTPKPSSSSILNNENAFKQLLYKYAILTSGRTSSPDWFSTYNLQYP